MPVACSNNNAMWNETERLGTRTGKDETTGFCDRGGDATIAHWDSQEAACTCEHIRDTNITHNSISRAVPAFIYAITNQCRCGTHMMARMKLYASITTITVPLAYVETTVKLVMPTRAVIRLPVHAMAMLKQCTPTIMTVPPIVWQQW